MPPVSLTTVSQQQVRVSENPFQGQVLLAQVTPDGGAGPDGGTATDATPPPVASDGGAPSDVTPPTPPPPPPVRLSLAQITAAARERATVLTDSHLLGSQYAAYQRDPSRYSVLRNAVVMIQYYIEGRHPDLSTSRPAILAWLRQANTSGDTVLTESLGNILAALGELTNDLNRVRGAAMAQQITEIQQMVSRPASAAPAVPPEPSTPPPPAEGSASASTASSPPPSSGSAEPSVATLRRRSERAVARAETTCSATPTTTACVNARSAAVRATEAYRDAVCEATPRAEACTSARGSAETARAARDAARSATRSTRTGETGETSPSSSTPPPPPPPSPTP